MEGHGKRLFFISVSVFTPISLSLPCWKPLGQLKHKSFVSVSLCLYLNFLWLCPHISIHELKLSEFWVIRSDKQMLISTLAVLRECHRHRSKPNVYVSRIPWTCTFKNLLWTFLWKKEIRDSIVFVKSIALLVYRLAFQSQICHL